MDVNDQRDTIRQCLAAIRNHVQQGMSFILVGGAGGILAGSDRTTSDLDLLLATAFDPRDVQSELLAIPGFSAPGGMLTFKGAGAAASMTIDFLKSIVLDKTYDDLLEHTYLCEGVALLNTDAALAIKLHCYNLRAEDNARSQRKKQTDLQDIVRLAAQMAEQTPTPLQISDSVAAQFRIGHYHLLLVRLEAEPATVADLVAVGVLKMLRKWEEDTPEQKEYFSYFAEPGACPLTGELIED